MKGLIAALCCVMLGTAPLALAQDKGKAPSEAQKRQQERMKSCNETAGDRKGDDRKKFMSSCLKGEDMGQASGKSVKQTAQQDRMKDCNKQASAKSMKGDERKKFMSSCLSG